MASGPYLFIFGRTPELAFLELNALYPCTKVSANAAIVSTLNEDPRIIMKKIGGTIKIVQMIKTLTTVDAASLATLFPLEGREVHFGVSAYGWNQPKGLLPEMKAWFAVRGMRSRYSIAKHDEALSSVTVDKQRLTECVVLKQDDGFLVGFTIAVQEYEYWGKRDFGRPHADAQAGMLPPKVARMVVNIAVGTKRPARVLDPFCGMGTVLAEAYSAGCHVSGSDTDSHAVSQAQENVRWAARTFGETIGSVDTIRVCDAVHVSEGMHEQSIDAIVTEPFMGSTSIATHPSVDSKKIRNIIKGLEKLYIGCLKDWHKCLVPGAHVVIALPEYAIGGKTYFVKNVVDMCENLGYTTVAGPIEYSRPQATVRRKFFVFKKN